METEEITLRVDGGQGMDWGHPVVESEGFFVASVQFSVQRCKALAEKVTRLGSSTEAETVL